MSDGPPGKSRESDGSHTVVVGWWHQDSQDFVVGEGEDSGMERAEDHLTTLTWCGSADRGRDYARSASPGGGLMLESLACLQPDDAGTELIDSESTQRHS